MPRALDSLTARERYIVQRRFLADEERADSLASIARTAGLLPGAVRQLETRIQSKLGSGSRAPGDPVLQSGCPDRSCRRDCRGLRALSKLWLLGLAHRGVGAGGVVKVAPCWGSLLPKCDRRRSMINE